MNSTGRNKKKEVQELSMAKRPGKPRREPRDTYGMARDRDGDMPEQYRAAGHKRGHTTRGFRVRDRAGNIKGPELVVKTPRGEIRVPIKPLNQAIGRKATPVERRIEIVETQLTARGVKPTEINMAGILQSGKEAHAQFLAAWERKHGKFNAAALEGRRIPREIKEEGTE